MVVKFAPVGRDREYGNQGRFPGSFGDCCDLDISIAGGRRAILFRIPGRIDGNGPHGSRPCGFFPETRGYAGVDRGNRRLPDGSSGNGQRIQGAGFIRAEQDG